jgi:hypothetical protein
MTRRDALFILIGLVLGTAVSAGYVEWRLHRLPSPVSPAAQAGSPASARAPGVYANLAAAQSDGQIAAAIKGIASLKKPLPPLPPELQRKAFTWVCRSYQHNTPAHGSENECSSVGRLAGLAGDAELLRLMVFTYFGEAEAEVKCDYVETFLQCHPELFFSLPDAGQLWHHAGDIECCNDPHRTIPLLQRFAFYTVDARKMLDEVTAEATRGDWAATEWGRTMRQALARH